MSGDLEFVKRKTIFQVEEGNDLAPKFDKDGLIPVVTTSDIDGEVLMLGYMNDVALVKTIETGEAHYFSRSRQKVWHKGATSGLIQKVLEMRVDDDQDAIWLRVAMSGAEASCHVGYRSCFYRKIPTGNKFKADIELEFRESEKVFDPDEVYGPDAENPTKL